MKSRRANISVLVMLLFVTLFIYSSCGCLHSISMDKEAKVLSVNTDILNGKTIGAFAISANNDLPSNNILVGIQIDFEDIVFLFDVELTHSEIVYYKDRNRLPITWMLDNFPYILYGHLNGREIISEYLTEDMAIKLRKEFEKWDN